MKCIKCGAEDYYDIVDYFNTRRISGHYIRCKKCKQKMFMAVNGEVYDTKNNQMTQAKFFQEQRILEESRDNNSNPKMKPENNNFNNRGSYYSNKFKDNKPKIRGYSNNEYRNL